MKVGDIVEINSSRGTVRGRVLSSSSEGTLSYLDLNNNIRRTIGIGPKGSPNVTVVERSEAGDQVPTPEWEEEGSQ